MDVRAINELVKNESEFVDNLMHEVSKVIVGQHEMVEGVVIGLRSAGEAA